jgi:CelD/BcsL family acetyltransferase involved in cellulose biosynthesis
MGGRRDPRKLSQDFLVAAAPTCPGAAPVTPAVTVHVPVRGGAVVPAFTRAPALVRVPPTGPTTEAGLRVEVVTRLDQLTPLVGAWRTLVHATPGATAFASPAFVLTWYRHMERSAGVHAVTVWRGDQLVGMAPFARTTLGGNRNGFLLLVTAGTEHGDHGEPLLGPDPAPVAAAITGHLTELLHHRSAAINARRLVDEGPMITALGERDDLVRVPMGQVAHAAVVRFDRLDDPYDYLDRLARRHSIPRRMRRLAEERGPVTYVPAVPGAAGRDAALDAMASMLLRRWGPEAGPRLFATPGRAAFTRAVTHALANDRMGRVSALTVAGRPAAVSTVLQVGNRLVSDSAGFDVDLCRYGVGQAELYALLRHALESGAVEVDMRAGDFPYKRKWTNAERRTRSVVLVAPGRRGEMALAARGAALRLRARRLRRLERRGPL